MQIRKISFLILGTLVFLLFPLNFLFGAVKKQVIINEVMWGKDSDGEEWIELKNLTDSKIILESWSIDNAKSAQKPLENIKGLIPPKGYFLICQKDSVKTCDFYESISLANDYKSNGKLVLKDKEGNIIDETPVPKDNNWPAGKSKDISMQRKFGGENPLDSWQDGKPPSPQSSGILLSANAGSNIISLANKEITFDGSASSGNIEEYFWNFGDGYSAQGEIVTHKYSFPGEYIASLRVSNSKEEDEALIEVTIFSNSIFISEFSLKEGWIEIISESENIQDISGWGLSSNKEGKSFIFPVGSYIAPKSFLFLSPSILDEISFNNNSLFLIYPSGDIRQEIKYEKDNGHSIVAKRGEDYFYTDTSTPGLPNIINLGTKKEVSGTSSTPNLPLLEEKSPLVLGETSDQEKNKVSDQRNLESETKESKIPEAPEKIFGENLLALVKRNQTTLALSALGTSIFSGFLGLGLVKLRRKIKEDRHIIQDNIPEKEKIEVEIEK